MSDTEERLAHDVTPTTDRRGQSSKERREARNRKDRERRAAAKSPAKRGPGRPRGSRNKTPPRNKSLEAPLREMLFAIGGVWGTTEAFRDHADPTCGEVLQDQAPDIARALNAVAQDDPSVYLWLDRMMTGGGWGAVAFAVLPVAQAFAGNHVLPAIQRRASARMGGAIEPPEDSPEWGTYDDGLAKAAPVESPEPADLGEPPPTNDGPPEPPTPPTGDPRPERPR